MTRPGESPGRAGIEAGAGSQPSRMRRPSSQAPPPAESKVPRHEAMDGPGEEPMLFREHARGQGLGRVVPSHGHPGLVDERPRVELRGHEMDGAAVLGRPCLERPFMGSEPGERGEQGRVDVDEPPGEPARERGPEDTHESGQHDEVGPPGPVDSFGQGIVEPGARAVAPVIESVRRNACRPCPIEGGSPGHVAQHLRDRTARVDE